MSSRRLGVLALVLATSSALCVQAAERNIDQLIKEFKGEAKSPERTSAQLEAAYGKVVDSLLAKLRGSNPSERKKAHYTLEQICRRAGRPGASAERSAVCIVIAAKLADTAMPRPARIVLIQQIELIGRNEVVERLADLMNDKDKLVRERARCALQANASAKVSAKLRAALRRATEPDWQIALINALGYRQDAASANDIIKLARGNDENVRNAAIEALARVGDKKAAVVIAEAMAKGSERARTVATNSYLSLAEELVRKGDKQTALAIYHKLFKADEHYRCAAIIGAAEAGGINEMHTILDAVADENPKVRGAGVAALGMLPAGAVTAAISARLKTAAPEAKAMMLRALSQRVDQSTLTAFIAASQDSSEDVRIAAYDAMAKLRNENAAEALVSALLKAKSRAESKAIMSAIDRIPGRKVTDAMVASLAGADAAGRVALINGLVNRRSVAVIPTFIKYATDEDRKVRSAACKALGRIADEKSLPLVVKLLVETKTDRSHAERAVTAVCKRIEDRDRRCMPVVDAMKGAAVPARCSLLSVLGSIQGDRALVALRAGVKDANPDIRDAAIRAMTKWDDGRTAEDLIAIAKTAESETHRVLALRAYVRVAALVTGKPPDEMLKLYEAGMAAAVRPEDRKMVLSGMATVDNIGAMKLAAKCMDDKDLKAEAAAAAVRIASAICAAYPDDARAALQKALKITKDDRVKTEAAQTLALIGKFGDFITAWEVSGPYTGANVFDQAFPPEKPDAKGVAWQVMKMGLEPGKPWLIALDKAIGGDNRAAYLRTNVWSPKKQSVRFELGSDDGIKVWLNGKVIHARNIARGVSPGQDKVNATLNQGWNRVLMKITQGSGQWAACAKIRTPDGKPLDGLRFSIDRN